MYKKIYIYQEIRKKGIITMGRKSDISTDNSNISTNDYNSNF